MKRNNRKKRRYVLGSTVLLLTLLLTACSGSVTGLEDLSESIGSTAGIEPEEIQRTAAQKSEPVSENEIQSQTPAVLEQPSSAEEHPYQKEENVVPKEPPKQENKAPAQETESQAAAENTTSISGIVESVENGSFVISQNTTSKSDNGSDLAINTKDDSSLVTVSFIDTTEFALCSSGDGGKTTSETAASSKDLANGKHVILEGAWSQNDFIAQKVTIYNFN